MGNKNKKVLFLTDIDTGLEHILQQETNIEPENMLLVQTYDSIISHPYGDIMRSIILAIYKENVEEVFVVGLKGKKNVSDELQSLLTNASKKHKTVDYLLKNCKPEFSGTSVRDWLDISKNVEETIKKNTEIIRHHPLVPSYVKIHGLLVNKNEEPITVTQ